MLASIITIIEVDIVVTVIQIVVHLFFVICFHILRIFILIIILITLSAPTFKYLLLAAVSSVEKLHFRVHYLYLAVFNSHLTIFAVPRTARPKVSVILIIGHLFGHGLQVLGEFACTEELLLLLRRC